MNWIKGIILAEANSYTTLVSDVIPVTEGHSITWTNLASGSINSKTISVHMLDAGGNFVDYYESRGTRTVTLPKNVYGIKICVEESTMASATVFDNTDDRYLFKDGEIVA